MSIKFDTRYSPEIQRNLEGTDNEFAVRMRNYVENSSQPDNYCVFENPTQYPITNYQKCGTDRDIGWIITFLFSDTEDSNYKVDFGTDFGGGAAIWVDGVLEEIFKRDLLWGGDWNSDGVFRLNYDFKAGNHTVLIIGQENCCDGDMVVQFSRNDQPPEPLTPGNFGCQTNNQCPVNCNTNQIQVGRNCENCSLQCASCSGSIQTCTQCSSSTRDQAPECSCKAKYYHVANQADCAPCHSSCATCTDSQGCSSCNSDQYLDGICKSCTSLHGALCGTCNKNECLSCSNNPTFTYPRCNSTTCNSNEYKFGQLCKPCNSQCKSCVEATSCTSCEENKYFQSGNCISCELQYGSHCGTCDQMKCKSCKTNPSYKLPLCTKTTCDQGQVAVENECLNCKERCSQCNTDGVTCTSCFNGSYLQNQSCLACQSPCQSCENQANNCTSCIKNNYDPANNCVNCLNRYFKASNQECIPCTQQYGANCGNCDSVKCIECLNNPSFTLPNCTSTTCPPKFYKDGNICKSCKTECATCSNATSCDSCNQFSYKGVDNLCHQCVGSSDDILYGPLCYNCNYKCAKCNYQELACTECGSNTREGIPNCNCKEKYFHVENQVACASCHLSCKTCSNANTCDSCESNNYLDGTCKSCQTTHGNQCGTCTKNECLTCANNPQYTLPRCLSESCNSNEYKVGLNCIACQSSCKSCVQANTCTECDLDKYLKNGLCVSCETTFGSQCGTCDEFQCKTCKNNPSFKLPLCVSSTCNPGETSDGNTCRSCEDRCEECPSNSDTCSRCVSGSYLLNADCPVCQSPCKTCVNSATNCTSCVKDNYDFSGGCINCINRHFKTDALDCVPCTDYYGSNCGQCNKTECTECLNNPSLVLPSCTQTTCPPKFWKDGNICRSCKTECATCSNASTCDSCKELDYLGTDNQCYNCAAAIDSIKYGSSCYNCNYKCSKCNYKEVACIECGSTTRSGLPNCNCKDTYFNVSDQVHCQACEASCKSCSNSTTCDSCDSGKYLDVTCKSCTSIHGNLCGECTKDECKVCSNNPLYKLPRCDSQQCLDKEFLVDKTCKSCHVSCKACVEANLCTQCENNQYMLNGLCVSCENTFGQKCGTCTQYKCLTCKSNALFKLPLCVKETCDGGQVLDGNLCRSCGQNCKVCSADLTTCTQCQDGFFSNSNTCTACQQACSRCENQANNCLSCAKNNYDPNSNCANCISGYFQAENQECIPCSVRYGDKCGQCNLNTCTECKNDASFLLPQCSSNNCPSQYYKDGAVCKSCLPQCKSCSDGLTCDSCNDMQFLSDTKQCVGCKESCFLCSSQDVCTICSVTGRAPPDCTKCQGRYLMNTNGQCTLECKSGYYGDYLNNECKQCNLNCKECITTAVTCTKCSVGNILENSKCLSCEEAKGYYQKVGVVECQEICGDGLKVSDQLGCDDGNADDGDGCDSKCQVEEGWTCSGGTKTTPDVCEKKLAIEYKTECYFKKIYLNIDENKPLECSISFSKNFTLPQGKNLEEYISVKIPQKNTKNFKITAKKKSKGQKIQKTDNQTSKQDSFNGPTYDISIQSDLSLKNRNLEVSFKQLQEFDDGKGNHLNNNEKAKKFNVKEYYYYSPEQRKKAAILEFFLIFGIVICMLFLPYYLLYYKNYFNQFYKFFFVIDILQVLFYYRFINIRWPMNGIKFFNILQYCTNLVMPNFFEKDITDSNFSDYSTGIQKFDLEKVTSLFLNNAGSLLSILIAFILLHSMVFLLSQKQIYCSKKEQSKIYQIFFRIRIAYLQWGIWFDVLQIFSGGFILYFILQMTNIEDMPNFIVAVILAVLYFGIFIAIMVYLIINRKILYDKENDKLLLETPIGDQIKKYSTFKLRNIWHFINEFKQHPLKTSLYHIYALRKVYLSLTLLTLSEHPIIQLALFAFGHSVVIYGHINFRFFALLKERIRIIVSEGFILVALSLLYIMTRDNTEDEEYRFNYSQNILALFLISIYGHILFFIYEVIIVPLYKYVQQRQQKKPEDDKLIKYKQNEINNVQDESNSYRQSCSISKYCIESRQKLEIDSPLSSSRLDNIDSMIQRKNQQIENVPYEEESGSIPEISSMDFSRNSRRKQTMDSAINLMNTSQVNTPRKKSSNILQNSSQSKLSKFAQQKSE